MRVLQEVVIDSSAKQWLEVGTYLEVPSAKLTELEANHPGDVKKRLWEVFNFWLKGNGKEPHTLGTLAQAIKMSKLPNAAENLLKRSDLCKEHASTE